MAAFFKGVQPLLSLSEKFANPNHIPYLCVVILKSIKYMATKPYPPTDETTSEDFMNVDFNESGDGSRPFTMAELNRWMDEVEAEDEEEAVPHEEVMRSMRELVMAYDN